MMAMASASRPKKKPVAPHAMDDEWWRQQDVAFAARQSLAALRSGAVAPGDVEGAVSTIRAALATTVLHPAERKRFERVASVEGLAPKRPALAANKARKNAETAECLKLIRLVEFAAAGFREGTSTWCATLDACVQHIYGALVTRGELRAAEHVATHPDLVRGAIDAIARPTRSKRTAASAAVLASPANTAIHRLVSASGFAGVSLTSIASIRSRRD